jgi:hypothetical protein
MKKAIFAIGVVALFLTVGLCTSVSALDKPGTSVVIKCTTYVNKVRLGKTPIQVSASSVTVENAADYVVTPRNGDVIITIMNPYNDDKILPMFRWLWNQFIKPYTISISYNQQTITHRNIRGGLIFDFIPTEYVFARN